MQVLALVLALLLVALPASERRGPTQLNADAALLRLAAWLSPAYPVGAFSYSHGVEYAVTSGAVTDAETLHDWVLAILALGSGRNDAIALVQAQRAAERGDLATLRESADLALAMAGSAERFEESQAQGRAFVKVTQDAWGEPLPEAWLSAARSPSGALAYPVAVALACASAGIDVRLAVTAYLHAFAANLANAGLRLIPLGQTDGQRITAAFEPVIMQVVREALSASTDDIGSAALFADLAAMQHETQPARLFRS